MKKKVTIVGAGISGLYLAYLLEDEYDITILEARERVGGRVFSIDGHDMGPSWVWSHQREILQLGNALGLEFFAQYTKGYALYDTKDKVEHFSPPPSAPSARVNGSLSTLVNALYKRLKSSNIIFSQEVQNVIQDGEEVLVKTLDHEYLSNNVIVTLPPRLVSKLSFSPELPPKLLTQLSSTPTWMGHTAKCVIEFKSSFWRKSSLSGFAFSHLGPLGEIHDASTATKHALFGFVSANADMSTFEKDLKLQLQRVFGVALSEIVAIYLVDWREEIYTASLEDKAALREHPHYGIDTSSYGKRVLFSSTEFSFSEGGYLEGAIHRAQAIAKEIRCS